MANKAIESRTGGRIMSEGAELPPPWGLRYSQDRLDLSWLYCEVAAERCLLLSSFGA